MIIKYVLVGVIAYLVYRGINPLKQVAPPQDPDHDDFADYEELD